MGPYELLCSLLLPYYTEVNIYKNQSIRGLQHMAVIYKKVL